MMSQKYFLIIILWLVFFIKTDAQIVVDFTASQTEGCGVLQVNFCDASTSSSGIIVAREWDLCGANSTMECPGRIFSTPGSCTICLTVTDAAGNTATDCKEDFITVFALPDPDFDAEIISGCSPLDVNFINLTTPGDGNITNLMWGVGGSCGVLEHGTEDLPPACTYTNPDQYTISLTVTDDNGCTNTITKPEFIEVLPNPELALVVSDTFNCEAPFLVNLALQAINPDVNYFWDFGNGTTFNGANPAPVTYDSSGLFSVQVIANNTLTGCRDTLFMEDFIQVGYPVDFNYTVPIPCVNQEFTFEDVSLMTADSIRWDFGDGNSSDVLNPVHTFAEDGCYTVSLVRYVNGCRNEHSVDCIQVNEIPRATFTVDSPQACAVPHTINFNGIPAGAVDTWVYDFLNENGNIIGSFEGQNGSFTFTEMGNYPIRLSVWDEAGCKDASIQDTIKIFPLEAAISSDDVYGCSPVSFALSENSITPGEVIDWQWEIETPAGLLSSTDETPEFTISDTGCYDVKLIVANSLGCVDTGYFENVICAGQPPAVNFEASPLVTCVRGEVFFNDLSSPYANEWAWDFDEDGEVDATEPNPIHEFPDTGFYDITLLAFHHGCGEQFTIMDYIEVLVPAAKMNVEQTCDELYNVYITNNAIGADSIFYDFGDPTVTTDTSSSTGNLMYSYQDTGTYRIMQQAFNFTTSCIDTAIVTVQITNPIARFSISDTTACAPASLTLNSNSDFGDTIRWFSAQGAFSDDMAAETEIAFDEPGIYNDIKLLISDSKGCQDSMFFDGQIWINDIDVNFELIPPGGCVPLEVEFRDNSVSLFSEIVSWEWLLMDSIQISEGPVTNYLFDTIGLFDVALTVEDAWGCSGSLLLEDTLSVSSPSAYFEADSVSCTRGEVQFISLSGGIALAYDWDFGDGNSSDEQAPKHNYANEGTYSVCLTVTAPDGCQDTFCREDFVTVADPVAGFSVDNTFASCPPLLVNFENTSSNATSYFWDFGDSSGSSDLADPSHIYTVPGEFDVMLIVSSTTDCQDTILMEDLISLEGPVGEMEFEVDDFCVPAVVRFKGTSIQPYDHIWDYGNGVLDTIASVDSSMIHYRYEESGNYMPHLILVDQLGCSRPLGNDTIVMSSLHLDFQPSDTALCDNSLVSYFNLTTTSHPVDTFEWVFEGGIPASSMNLIEPVSYMNAGNFDVTLIGKNEFCKDTLTMLDLIGVGDNPEAGFSFSPESGCEPLTVEFQDTSTVNPGLISSWLWDFGNGAVSSEQHPTQVFDAGDNIDIKLKVTTDVGCVDSVTNQLDVLQVNQVSFDEMPIVCQGEAIELHPEIQMMADVDTFYWITNQTLSCRDCMYPVARPQTTTTYYFVVKNTNGCEDSFPITVEVSPYSVPDVELSQDTTICKGDIVQLFASGGDNIYEYEWDESVPGLSCYEHCFNPVASPQVSADYTVVVTNAFGCSDSRTVRVNVIDDYMPIAGDDRMVCMGDPVQLHVEAGSNPEWRPSTGLDCVFCENPVAMPDKTMEYSVKAYTEEGCMIQDTVKVEIVYPEEIDAGEEVEICTGSSIVLEGIGEGNVEWSPAEYVNNENLLNPVASPPVSTMFNMTITKGDCIMEDSVFVRTIEKTNIEGMEVLVCPDEGTQLGVDGFADEYRWLPADFLSNPDIENPYVTTDRPIDYQVIAKLGTCEPDTTIVSVGLKDSMNVTLATEHRFFPGQDVTMTVAVDTGTVYYYEWLPTTGLNCSYCPSVTLTPQQSGIYSVTVTNSETGCSKVLTTTVQLVDDCDDELISVPNIFSPNDDNINDELFVMSSTITHIDNFTIFDRWGAIVFSMANFEPNNPQIAWNGISKNGLQMPSGVYVYFLEATCDLDGSKIMKKGNVTLLR